MNQIDSDKRITNLMINGLPEEEMMDDQTSLTRRNFTTFYRKLVSMTSSSLWNSSNSQELGKELTMVGTGYSRSMLGRKKLEIKSAMSPKK